MFLYAFKANENNFYYHINVIGIIVALFFWHPSVILYDLLSKQEGASKEDIEQLSKFKFSKRCSDEKLAGDAQGPCGGIMTECGTDSPVEHVLSQEDAVCRSILLLYSFYALEFYVQSFCLLIV